MMCRKDKIEQSQTRRRLSTNIFQTILCATCFKQVLYMALILNIAMAIKTDMDYGNCENAPSDERLPVSVIEPIHYKLLLNLDMEYGIFHGESDIVINIHIPIKRLSLHCLGPYIYTSSISLRLIKKVSNQSVEYSPYASYRFCTVTQMFDILFSENIFPGLYNLYMRFDIYDKTKDIIRYQYTSVTGTETEATRRWFYGILSTSNRARTVFPCWDEPEIHMNYEITVKHSEQYEVISNIPVKRLLHKSNDTSLTYFRTSKPIASSQVAVIMFDNMKQYSLDDEYLWHQLYMEGGTNTLQEIWYIKHCLTTYLGVDDRIMKTDHIVIPNFPYQVIGSLGVIIYREQSLKYDKSTDFPGRQVHIYKMIGDVLAREVLAEVICPPYFWLIKILSSFLSHFVIFQYGSHSSFLDLSTVQTMQGALYHDVDFQMAPVSQNKFLFPIDAIDAIHYSRLYYNKGAALMRMLLYSLGKQEYFYNSIQKCVEKCEDTSASVKGLWTIEQSVLTGNEKLRYNITEIIDTWITQRHFPEVKVYRNYSGNSAILSAYNCNETKWKIPITHVTMSTLDMYDKSEIILFDCSNKGYIHKIVISDFLIVNTKQMGYYRVNYDSGNWGRISMYLNFHNYTQIDVVNRAQLIDDAYYFMINDKLDISIFLRLIRYLKRERNYVAWYPMFNILIYMSKFFELPQSAYFKPYVFEILDSLLEKVGYEERTKDDDMTKSLRLLGLKWACKFGHKVCKTTATSKLTLSLKGSFRILPWWKEWVYCAGMMEADLNVCFEVFFENFGIFSQKQLTYLTCSENEHALIIYLENFWNLQCENLKISNRICTDPKEAYDMIIAVYRSFVKKHARKNAVLKYILRNYDKLPSTILGSMSPVAVLGITIMELYSEDNFKQVTEFVKSTRYLTEEEKSKIEIFVKQRKIQLEKISNHFHMF